MSNPPREPSQGPGQSKREGGGAPLPPGLYLVATPIGNLRDITLRALDVLRGADLVACEDTRVSRKLLDHYGISATLQAYHDHNAARVRPALIDRLRAGGRVALISDAGSPLVSDPGYRLVREAAEAGLPVTAVPGASAAVAGLQLAGLPNDRFLFAGFPPPKAQARRKLFGGLAGVEATLVFFESAKRLPASLADMAHALPGREAAVARELTKLHEEVRRGPVEALAAHYAEAGPPKGEVVLLVGPPPAEAAPDPAEVDAALAEAVERLGVRGAADEVAARFGLGRRDAYQRALALRRDPGRA